MTDSRFFSVAVERKALVVTPLQNISSLADAEVSSQWGDILSQLEQSGAKHVVFDFEKLSYFGSSMLEAMLVLWKRIHPDDGKMAICNTADSAREILQLSKFDTIWPIYDSRQEALDAVEREGRE